MGIVDWRFSDAEQVDGRYHVRGVWLHTCTYEGEPNPSGVGFDSNGLIVVPVTGEGDTPDAARDAAVYAAGLTDQRRWEMQCRAIVAVMTGGRY